MGGARSGSRLGFAMLAVVTVLTAVPALGQTPRSGGQLNLRLREDLPQGFALHETTTISSMWPAMPCLSNLVLFDPLKPLHSADTIIGELAEKWTWENQNRNLVFVLRKGVRWHDGKPFSSADVKATFDMLRETPEATGKLRINPRRDWFSNIEAVDTPDAHTVVLRLKRPQPSLLLLLASGFTPIYAAHVPPASYRTGCVGTGPFKLTEWRKGEFVEYVKNADYFVKGRPYLDRLRYVVISDRSMGISALQTAAVDVTFPGDTTRSMGDRLKAAAPQLTMATVNTSVMDHLVVNTRKPPFDNVNVRLALSHAIDRRSLIQGVYHGGAITGASLMPRPHGVWGLLDEDLRALPGHAPAQDKARAKKLLAEAGFGPGKPLKVEMLTRALPAFVDLASFVVNELKQVGVEATVRQVESAQWFPLQTRGEFQIGVDRTGVEPDDPDADFYENYGCRSPRNYTGYCNDEITRLIDQQSQELDPARRRGLVHALQKKLEEAAVRPALCWRLDYFSAWPYVKNLVPHHSLYGWGRLQEVWLDK